MAVTVWELRTPIFPGGPFDRGKKEKDAMKTNSTVSASPDTHASGKRRLLLAAIILAVLGIATTANAGPLWLRKIENAGRYIQVGIHGQINTNHIDSRIPMPAQCWTTPVTFNETDQASGDSLQITGSSQHIVAVCASEAPQGGVFNYALSFANPTAGTTQAVQTGFTLHPGPPDHKDMFISAAVVNCANPGQIDGFGYISIGRHDPPGCAVANSLMKPETANPLPSDPYAVSSAIYEEADEQLSLGVAVPGIGPNDVTGFYLGDKSSGQVLLDLFPLTDWQDAATTEDGTETGVVGTAGFADVLLQMAIADEILVGNAFLAIQSNLVPNELLIGDLNVLDVELIPEPSSLALLMVGTLGLLMRRRSTRR